MSIEQSQTLNETASEIRLAVTRLARLMRTGRSSDALSSNKISVLGHLQRYGPATPGELAAAERQQPQSLTRVFAELEQQRLVSRTRDERDRRQSLLAITPLGHSALVRDLAERDAWLASALAGLSETERDVLRLAASLMAGLTGTAENPAEKTPEKAAEKTAEETT